MCCALAAPPGELLIFGAQHTRDPRHPQLSEIERLWREFRPQIAFSEGGIRPAARSRDEAITRFGESGLLRYLADRDYVALRNLEPPEYEEAAAPTAQDRPGPVKLFYVLRSFPFGFSGRRAFPGRHTAVGSRIRAPAPDAYRSAELSEPARPTRRGPSAETEALA